MAGLGREGVGVGDCGHQIFVEGPGLVARADDPGSECQNNSCQERVSKFPRSERQTPAFQTKSKYIENQSYQLTNHKLYNTNPITKTNPKIISITGTSLHSKIFFNIFNIFSH